MDDFHPADELAIGWYSVRTPYKKYYSLVDRQGYLRVWGNAYNLTEKISPSIYLQKQTALTQTWSTSVDFQPRKNTTWEASVALWLNETSHQILGIQNCEIISGNRYVVARTFTGPNSTQVVSYSYTS